MENFDPKPNAVREKNLYIVHLDTPRIIILSSVVIGIITAAFLLGMTLMKDDKSSSKELIVSGMSFDDNKSGEIFGADIPPVPGDSAEESNIDEKISSSGALKDSGIAAKDSKIAPSSELAASTREVIKHEKGDFLTNENIREIIPPVPSKNKESKKTVKLVKNEKKSQPESSKKIAGNDTRKSEARHDLSDSKSGIYEVSRDISEKKGQGYYSVQVASYDTLSKAENEKSLLRSKRYDAYIDKGLVNGRNYYRVRIGPVSSSKKAYELLNDVQSDSRYASSYMVKE